MLTEIDIKYQQEYDILMNIHSYNSIEEKEDRVFYINNSNKIEWEKLGDVFQQFSTFDKTTHVVSSSLSY